MFFTRKSELIEAEKALPGRSERPFHLSEKHTVLDAPILTDTAPEGYEVAIFGLGCFWGAEEIFWKMDGVWSTSAGYAGGTTPHPSYEEVCSGRTNHTEAVRVVYDPSRVSFADLVKTFFEVHDPTQGMRQGNDVGTQYRSGIYVADDAQRSAAEATRDAFAPLLAAAHFDPITTEIVDRGPFYFAEEYHQQYLARNPMGYCGLGDTGLTCPTGVLG